MYAPSFPQPQPPSSGSSFGWGDFIPAGLELYQGFSGGGSTTPSPCWGGYNNHPQISPCPNTPDYAAVARAVSRAPDATIGKLIGYLLGGNDGRGPKTRAELLRPECLPHWTKAVLGGKDCRASRYPEAPAFLRSMVATYGGPQAPGESLPGATIPGGFIPGGLAVPAAGGAGMGIVAAGLALLVLPKLFGKKTRRR